MNKSLLLVDDETSILRSLKRLFRREGYDVTTADSPEQALELFEQEQFPVVLSDYRMPMKTGGELLKEIKSKNPETLGMILSGYADMESVMDALNSGAVHKFLEKPWDEVKLLDEVKNAFHHIEKNRASAPKLELKPQGKVSLVMNRSGVITEFQAGIDVFNGQKTTALIGTHLCDLLSSLNSSDVQGLCLSDEVSREVIDPVSGVVFSINSKPLSFQSWEISICRWTEEQIEAEKCAEAEKRELAHCVESRLASSEAVTLFYLNIRHFKYFNESLGYSQSDQLLKQVINLLHAQSSDIAKLTRLNGAEFICAIPSELTEQQANGELERLLSPFENLISFQDREVMLTFAAGYVVAPEDGVSFDQLVQRAKSASDAIKHNGKGRFPRYQHQKSSQVEDRISLESEMCKALERKEFEVFYQPKVSLRTGKILGAEALIRWHHSEKGSISPAQFIPLAESTGQINEIGEWVLSEASSQSSLWSAQGLPEFTLAVNVSGRQLVDTDLVGSIAKIIEEVGLAPERLELEVTETYLIQDIEHSIETLKRLKKLGVKIALDDFGTGYSSLNYLNRLPIDTLKVDRSFILDLVEIPEKKTLIKNLIALSHDLGMRVVAEGVETSEQLAQLQQMKCDEVQGYYFSPPVSAEAFKALLEQQINQDNNVTGNDWIQ